MKVIKEKINEEFGSEEVRLIHFRKHVTGEDWCRYPLFPHGTYQFSFTDEDLYNAGLQQYEMDADELAQQVKYCHPALSYKEDEDIKLVGYISVNGGYLIYKRNIFPLNRGEMVVFYPNRFSGRHKESGTLIASFYVIDDDVWEDNVTGKGAQGKLESEFPHNQEGGKGPMLTPEEKQAKKEAEIRAKAERIEAEKKAKKDAARASYEKKNARRLLNGSNNSGKGKKKKKR